VRASKNFILLLKSWLRLSIKIMLYACCCLLLYDSRTLNFHFVDVAENLPINMVAIANMIQSPSKVYIAGAIVIVDSNLQLCCMHADFSSI
jgi:hypothetical protein